jgi:hypothetical protein
VTDRVHYHPDLIFSLGTQVVTLIDIPGSGIRAARSVLSSRHQPIMSIPIAFVLLTGWRCRSSGTRSRCWPSSKVFI